MTRAGMFTKHRGVAFSEVDAFLNAGKYVRGYTVDDLRQEALVALWGATGTYDPAKGRFLPYAAVAIRFRLADLIRLSTNGRRRALDEAWRPDQLELAGIDATVDTVERRDSLRRVLDALEDLEPDERHAVVTFLTYEGRAGRTMPNGVTRRTLGAAREKLRARLQPQMEAA